MLLWANGKINSYFLSVGSAVSSTLISAPGIHSTSTGTREGYFS